jgi:hypothetical protein
MAAKRRLVSTHWLVLNRSYAVWISLFPKRILWKSMDQVKRPASSLLKGGIIAMLAQNFVSRLLIKQFTDLICPGSLAKVVRAFSKSPP